VSCCRKKAAQQQWCNKNPSYFRGPINVQRVKKWRSKHPGYWKDNLDSNVLGHADALQGFREGVLALLILHVSYNYIGS
jgi:hypothetical protein